MGQTPYGLLRIRYSTSSRAGAGPAALPEDPAEGQWENKAQQGSAPVQRKGYTCTCRGQLWPTVLGSASQLQMLQKVYGETKRDDALSALTWISPQRLGVSGSHIA